MEACECKTRWNSLWGISFCAPMSARSRGSAGVASSPIALEEMTGTFRLLVSSGGQASSVGGTMPAQGLSQ